MKSQDLEVNVLTSMEDVTAKVNESTKGAKNADEEFAKRKAGDRGNRKREHRQRRDYVPMW